MASTSVFLFIVLSCSWALMGSSQDGGNLECLQKLMPCEPYLKGSGAPPATCCVPLKEMVEHDAHCLCQVFNNEALLKSFNVTKDEALALVKNCGANADTSLCKKASSPAAAPSTNGSGNASTPSSSKKNAASGTSYSYVGGCVAVAAAVIFSIIAPAFLI